MILQGGRRRALERQVRRWEGQREGEEWGGQGARWDVAAARGRVRDLTLYVSLPCELSTKPI